MTTSPIQGRTPGAMGHAVAAPPAPPLLGTPLEPYRLSPLEIAWGWVGGGLMGPVQDVENSSRGVIGAMEAALLPALVRTPCLIQFSGGRDSSVILAIALRLARKEGLDLPIAVTQRFVGIEEADEDAWQESVVRHLGVRDWERVAWRDELDIVGPIAGPSLEARGLVWPTLAHTHWPLIEQANKGSLVTGEGGDEVLGQRRASVARALVAHPRRNLRQMVPATSAAIAPRMVRTRELRRRYDKSLATPWLRPEPRAALLDVLARDQAAEPFDWRQA
ncbi:MAG: asparagine synthase-related protein, partial [Acidimicrobiales bacterium]